MTPGKILFLLTCSHLYTTWENDPRPTARRSHTVHGDRPSFPCWLAVPQIYHWPVLALLPPELSLALLGCRFPHFLPSFPPTTPPISLSEICVLQWGELGTTKGLLILKALESTNGSRRIIQNPQSHYPFSLTRFQRPLLVQRL